MTQDAGSGMSFEKMRHKLTVDPAIEGLEDYSGTYVNFGDGSGYHRAELFSRWRILWLMTLG